MKRLLLQLDSDRLPSAFDQVVAHDAGADDVLGYGGVTPDDVQNLIYGAIFTRGPKDLKNTAVFIGGSSMSVGEKLLEAAKKSFFGPFKVSLMLDPNGSNTTAVAAVRKLVDAAGGVKGKRVWVLAGTGPVGLRSAGLFLQEGADVTITTRDEAGGERARAAIQQRFGRSAKSVATKYPIGRGSPVDDADVVLASGPPGVQLLKREVYAGGKGPRVLGDANAVPPYGIEGVEPNDDGVDRDGAKAVGALGIGNLKMKLHKTCIAHLFEANDRILDAETIYEIGRSL